MTNDDLDTPAPAPSPRDSTPADAPTRVNKSRRSATEVRTEVTKRLKLRNGRYVLDLRDLGKGREALIPEGQAYGTKDELVALHLAGIRLKELFRPEHERYFGGTELKRTETLGQFAREWLAHARDLAGEGFASVRTLRRYEQAFTQAFAVTDHEKRAVLDQDARIDRVTVSDVKAVIRALRKTTTRAGGPTSASSLHQLITGMQRLYDHASGEGVVPEDYNPWRQLNRQDRPSLPRQSRTDFLEIYEAHALLLVAPGLSNVEIPVATLASAYLHTGGRKMEVLGLEFDDVDFRRKLVRFVSNQWRSIKDYDERSVPMWPALERDLRAYLATRVGTSSLVFEGQNAMGHPQMITSYHKAFKRAQWAAAALLGDVLGPKLLTKAINPRMFRVTYCSARLQTLDNGKPVASWTVEAEMGHNSGKMIKRVYGRIGEMRHRSDVVEYVPRPEAEQQDEQEAEQWAERDAPPSAPSDDARRVAS